MPRLLGLDDVLWGMNDYNQLEQNIHNKGLVSLIDAPV